jgi:hypothetical protein
VQEEEDVSEILMFDTAVMRLAVLDSVMENMLVSAEWIEQ